MRTMSGSKRYLAKDPMSKRKNSIIGSRGAGKYYYRGRGYWSKEDLSQDYAKKTGPDRIGYGIKKKGKKFIIPKNLRKQKDYSHYGDYKNLKSQARAEKWK